MKFLIAFILLTSSHLVAADLGMFEGRYGCAVTRGAPEVVKISLLRGSTDRSWLFALEGQNMPGILAPATALNRTNISQDAEFRVFMGWQAPIILVTKLRGTAVGDVNLTIPERFTAPLVCSKL